MNHDEAIELIRRAPIGPGGTWGDLGAGAGAFTRALASLLGPTGTVYAVDRDASSLRDIERSARRPESAAIRTVAGDFTGPLDRPPLELPLLDGVLVANALHYVSYREQATVLRRIAARVAGSGPIVIVEYDRRNANRWVPYPIAPDAFADLATAAGLGKPTLLGTRPSAFSGSIYSALVRRAPDE